MRLVEKAEAIVDEMISLGAVFEVEPTDTGTTWVWRARPPTQRDAVAAAWNAAEKPPGIRVAMLAAIRRRAPGGAL